SAAPSPRPFRAGTVAFFSSKQGPFVAAMHAAFLLSEEAAALAFSHREKMARSARTRPGTVSAS
ncbi:hypothetical protein, partial [Xanthomonas vesicatoria]|uniref:hypothetical protein n=1 Tax=Xanthomonas vesicatoria TaxID=56460 RepID=UPI001E4981D8